MTTTKETHHVTRLAKATSAFTRDRSGSAAGSDARAFATRGASAGVKGSGAHAHRRALALLLATALAGAALCLGATLASAVSVNFEFVDSFGSDGTNLTGFETAGSVAVDQEQETVYVLDRQAGALFKFDFEGNPVNFGGASPNITGNKLSGLSLGASAGLGSRQVAVDQGTHTIYLTGNAVGERATAVQAFHSDGTPSIFSAGAGEGTNEIPGFYGLHGVGVDSNGNVYASGVDKGQSGDNINVYKATGALLLEKAGGIIQGPTNLAVDSNGVLYVVQSQASVRRYTPSEYPITASTTYTPAPDPVDPKGALSVSVNPLTNQLYVVEFFLDKEENRISQVVVFSESGTPESVFAGAGQPGELERPDGIAVATIEEPGVEGPIAQPLVASNPNGDLAQVEIFREKVCICAPSIESIAATFVSGDSATFRAKINPNNRDTTYWFEYGLEDCAISLCARSPLDGAPIGDGREGVVVTQLLTGLEAQTTYHYRVVAQNSEGVTATPDRSLTTQVSGVGFELPDRRAWEMVSPPDKHGALLVGVALGQIQAAEDGNGLAYLSVNSVEEDPEGSRVFEPASVLARRGPAGWRSEDIATAHDRVVPVSVGQRAEYKLFSSDLSRGLVEPRGATLLSSKASERTPYLRENAELGYFVPLVTGKEGFANVPSGTEFGGNPDETFGPVKPQGASSDLEHVVLFSFVSLGVGPGLYRWSEGQLRPVSVLPGGEGGGMVGAGEGVLGSGAGSVRHAISEDGSRVFWENGYAYGDAGMTALYLRDMVAEESVRLDLLQPGASGAGLPRPAFQGANAEGTVVYFTDSRDLTEDASPEGRDLYRCEIPAGAAASGCATLTNVSAPLPGSGESAMVKDMSPALSEDGSRIYFVAEAVLDTAPNEEGDAAVGGEPNLYLFEAGEGVRFVATLSEDDRPNWGQPKTALVGFAAGISADASPSGRYLSFMSEHSLTGYENRDAVSDEPTEEAFLYDAASGELLCASCNPTGSAPHGRFVERAGEIPLVDQNSLWDRRWLAASLPQATTIGVVSPSFSRPRSVFDNGRVLFNAADALVPADSNGQWDVYQWEPTGVGDCTASSKGPSTSRSSGGCVSLLSSGTAEKEAAFLDASATGDDVFFLTSAQLNEPDEDSELDIYDARVDGIPATLPKIAECLGEACQGSYQAPTDPTPASATFRGPAEEPKASCPRGKRQVKRNGKPRCVPRKHKKAKHKRRSHRAGSDRRAGR